MYAEKQLDIDPAASQLCSEAAIEILLHLNVLILVACGKLIVFFLEVDHVLMNDP
jgi:predicted RNA methylase